MESHAENPYPTRFLTFRTIHGGGWRIADRRPSRPHLRRFFRWGRDHRRPNLRWSHRRSPIIADPAILHLWWRIGSPRPVGDGRRSAILHPPPAFVRILVIAKSAISAISPISLIRQGGSAISPTHLLLQI